MNTQTDRMQAKDANLAKPDPALAGLAPLAGALIVELQNGLTPGEALARASVSAGPRHADLATTMSREFHGGAGPSLMDMVAALEAEADKAVDGNLAMSSRLLMTQAITLDGLFTQLARRALPLMAEHPQAMERYMRLALKAQSNSRATLEALAKLHQPREQTVRHVHVNEGGQAVIADQFHNHAGVRENAEAAEQPHAAGTGGTGSGPAMLGEDAEGIGLPISSDQGREAMPDARRQGQRRA